MRVLNYVGTLGLVMAIAACGGGGETGPSDGADTTHWETLDDAGGRPDARQFDGRLGDVPHVDAVVDADGWWNDLADVPGDDMASDVDGAEAVSDAVPVCGPGQALHGSTCIPCANPCDAEGETGLLWPAASNTGKCVCETEAGWFYTEGIDVGTYQCDVDGDGWVAESARLSVNSKDPAIVENARCDVRSIDRVELRNEAGETKTVMLVELAPNLQSETLDLYEPDHLDDAGLQKWMDLAPYQARQLLPEELNPLVRYCADADYNGNGIKDFAEWHNPNAEVPGNPHLAPFVTFSYFGELHEAWYEDIVGGAGTGQYIISEKSRDHLAPAAEQVPVLYDEAYEASHGAPSEEDVVGMARCVLWPDPSFDPEASDPTINQDFAQFGPTAPSNDFARTVEVAEDVFEVVPENHWDGMNLHSQFRCVQFVNTPPDDPTKEPNKLVKEDFEDAFGLKYQMNLCGAQGSDDVPESAAPEDVNPWQPLVACTPIGLNELTGGQVGWAAVRFRSGAPYAGGCVDQCTASTGCGLCGKGVWLAQDGKKCGLETTSAGYAGIPAECLDVAHPADLAFAGYVCDGCDWQDGCEDGLDCTINLCHVDGPDQCAPAIDTPDDFACADDGNECTADFCAAGECLHPAREYGWPCGNQNHQCRNFGCGFGGAPKTCAWLSKTGDACQLSEPNDCLEPECTMVGTCGQPKPEGTDCTIEDDANECTQPGCAKGGTCEHQFVGEGVPCSSDGNMCTEDICTKPWPAQPPICDHDGKGLEGTSCDEDVPETCDASVCKKGVCDSDGTTCKPGQQEGCKMCGQRTCTDLCQWGDCEGWLACVDEYDLPTGNLNETKLTATDFGTYQDAPNPAPQTKYATLVPQNDVDWYKFKIEDTGAEGNPSVTLTFTPFPVCNTTWYTVEGVLSCDNNAAKKTAWSWPLITGAQPFVLFKYTLDCDGTGKDDMNFHLKVAYHADNPQTCTGQYAFKYEIK